MVNAYHDPIQGQSNDPASVRKAQMQKDNDRLTITVGGPRIAGGKQYDPVSDPSPSQYARELAVQSGQPVAGNALKRKK